MKSNNNLPYPKKIFALSASAVLLSSLVFIGCKKESSFDNVDPASSATQEVTADAATDSTGERSARNNVRVFSVDTKSGTSRTTHSLRSVPAGALLVLTTSNETSLQDASISSSPSLTWTKKGQAHKENSGDAEIYTAVFPAGGSINVTSTWPMGATASALYVVINQESTLGGSVQSAVSQSSASVNIATTKANSLLLGVTSDWKAVDGSKRSYLSGANEILYTNGAQTYSTYHYYKNAASQATYKLGLNTPSGMSAGTVVLEVRGKSGSTTTTPPPTTVTPPETTTPPTTNQAPVIGNIAAQTITLPVNSVTLNGTATDADGSVVSYLWTKVSGTGGTISTPNAATTTVTGLTAGSYVYNLRVTDNAGATANKTVSVTVNPATTTTPPSTNYGTMTMQTGYENSTDVNTNQGQYNSRSSSVKKSGSYSFRTEVRENQPNLHGGYRSEMQYSVSPVEAVIEYDVYYENWKAFQDGGHTIQWHPQSSTGSAVLSLQNYGGKFMVVRAINGVNSYSSAPMSVVPNKWYNMRWEVKWANNSTGYVRFYIDGQLYYSYTGITTDQYGTPYLKVGQNRWPNSGSSIKETAVVYYDDVKVYSK